ncbi:unnamed protein product, partial [Mesorhabditis belari]|uniref:AAA+ ATPase domain-containing protein n=1 Tax=Mesorhabditis belari TaxID=2138241 RepID=A0AAF3J895_9BILA
MQLSSFGMSKSMVLYDPLAPNSPRVHRKATDSRTVIGTASNSEYGSPRSAHHYRHRPPPPVRGSSPHSARLPLSVASPQHNGSLYARRTPEAVYANFRGDALHRIPDEITMSPSHREKGSPSDFRGSNLSVASSTAYNSLAEKYEAELRKLNRELDGYRKTVNKLTRKQEDYSQIAEMVDQRLSHLGNKMEKAQLKPQELAKLKQEIENLRNLSARLSADSKKEGAGELLRHPSLESVASHRSSMSSSSKSSKTDKSSLNSFNSKGKKSWIRSSFSKAFTRKKNSKNGGLSDSDGSPMHHPLNTINASNSNLNELGSVATVVELKRQLQDRDHTLTDVRLDALDCAREVDQLRETVNRLKHENKQLRADMSRLVYTGRSRTSSKSSLLDDEHLYEHLQTDRSTSSSSKRSSGCQNSVKVVVNVDLTGSIPIAVCPEHEITIGYLTLPERETRWDQLDAQIYALFDAYLCRIDPDHHLGLHCSESVIGYTIGKISRERGSKESSIPPSQVITTTTTIRLFLRGACQSAVDSLILECLFPRSLLDQLLKHIVTHRRLVLSGATGIGKSNLARQLCAYLSIRAGRAPDSVIEVKIPDDGKDKQLVQVERDLEKALRGSDSVLLLDNIPKSRISFVSSVFDSIQLSTEQGPYIICTINRACQLSEMQMQLQHNFKIFLLTNKMEAVNGYMARYLRRRIIDTEYRTNRVIPTEIQRIVDFFSIVLSAINEFIERSNSLDATVGARVFLQCPLDVEQSRAWFIELWNETLVPYMMKVYREGVKILGRCGNFDDPTDRICEHWPWQNGKEIALQRLPIKEALSQPIARQSFSPLDALMKLQTRPSLLHENL